MAAALERLGRANADISAAVEGAAAALEVLATSDARQLDAFRRHADAAVNRIAAAQAAICAHAHLADELGAGADGADGLLVHRTRLAPARQRLHLAHLVATSASESLGACIREAQVGGAAGR